jgi:hypothetical protein
MVRSGRWEGEKWGWRDVRSVDDTGENRGGGQTHFAHVVSTNYSQYNM